MHQYFLLAKALTTKKIVINLIFETTEKSFAFDRQNQVFLFENQLFEWKLFLRDKLVFSSIAGNKFLIFFERGS